MKTYLNWTKEKPIFDNNSAGCLLLVASKCRAEWDYTLFEMRKIDFEENWYWGILNEYGDEYGDYADLEAQLYCILPLLPKSTK